MIDIDGIIRILSDFKNGRHVTNSCVVMGKKGRTLLYKFYCICLTVGCGIL